MKTPCYVCEKEVEVEDRNLIPLPNEDGIWVKFDLEGKKLVLSDPIFEVRCDECLMENLL